LSLGATPLVAADVLPRAIKEFWKYRPDLRIHVFDGDHPTLMQRVQNGGSPQEFVGTRIIGRFLEDHEFGPGRRHTLALQE